MHLSHFISRTLVIFSNTTKPLCKNHSESLCLQLINFSTVFHLLLVVESNISKLFPPCSVNWVCESLQISKRRRTTIPLGLHVLWIIIMYSQRWFFAKLCEIYWYNAYLTQKLQMLHMIKIVQIQIWTTKTFYKNPITWNSQRAFWLVIIEKE